MAKASAFPHPTNPQNEDAQTGFTKREYVALVFTHAAIAGGKNFTYRGSFEEADKFLAANFIPKGF